jgi:hypothetical protein
VRALLARHGDATELDAVMRPIAARLVFANKCCQSGRAIYDRYCLWSWDEDQPQEQKDLGTFPGTLPGTLGTMPGTLTAALSGALGCMAPVTALSTPSLSRLSSFGSVMDDALVTAPAAIPNSQLALQFAHINSNMHHSRAFENSVSTSNTNGNSSNNNSGSSSSNTNNSSGGGGSSSTADSSLESLGISVAAAMPSGMLFRQNSFDLMKLVVPGVESLERNTSSELRSMFDVPAASTATTRS